ncbi:hypothetical protein [Pseudonocardia sp. ICBG601]|uniref:hypothetical protein n=1 Tax=Pseudonocardia sp. ICBG601 TaxID=2846759 RepID=UPI001CF6C2E5|nr:hypothetical protein [Pseudonocardia sp. ICBG601]
MLLRSVRPLRPGCDGLGDPVDVLLDGGRVRAVGAGLDPGGAEVVECDGRALLPGLWDHYVHMAQ